MKVTVGQIVSTPPTAQSLAVQVVRDALRIVAARLQAAGLGDREVKIDALDLAMPVPAGQLGTSLERSRAARTLAGRIITQVGPGLGLAPDAALAAGTPARGDLVHAKAMQLIRRALQGISYAPQVKVVSVAKPQPRAFGGMGKIKSFFGLGGGKTEIVRTEQTPELVGDNRSFVADFYAVEARMNETGGVSRDDFARLRDGLGKHLSRNGVAFEQTGSEFTIKPERRGSQLNVLAYSAKKKLGVTISYTLGDRLKPGASVGSFSSDKKHLNLDHRSVLYCRPSGTALHELHHGALYDRIDKGKDTFLNLKMWNMRPREEAMSSAQMYTASMSNQELSTFAKQPRQVVALHLRDSKTYSEALDKDLRVYLWKLSQVALQGKEVASKVIPEIQAFLATGKSDVLKFGVNGDGDLEVKFWSNEKGLFHRLSIHTHGAAHKKQVGHSKLAGQQALARDLLEKMELTHDVSELLMLQSHVVSGELRNLNTGQDLIPEEIKILQDLATWPGYSVRVAADATKTFQEKKAELARQRALAEGRLGVQPGGVMNLPILEIGSSSAGADDDILVRASPMSMKPHGSTLRPSSSRAVKRAPLSAKTPAKPRDLERVLQHLEKQTPDSSQAMRGLWRLKETDITTDNSERVLEVAQKLDPKKRVYALRQRCLQKNPLKITTPRAYTDGASKLPTDKASMKTYIKQPANWCPKRAEIHQRIIDQEMVKAQSVADRMLSKSSKPTILMMRGNSGSGKTYALKNSDHQAIRGLNVTDPTLQGDPEGLLNPDDIKYRLAKEFEGGKATSSQVHSEGSMITEKLIDTMLQRKQSMVLDKRFGLAEEVQKEVCVAAKNHGYRIVMIDMDAALDTSCSRVSGRELGGKAPNVSFKAVAHGFQEIRGDRPKIKKLCEDKEIDAYFLFKSDGPKRGTLVAEKLDDGTFIVHDDALWKEATEIDQMEIVAAKDKWSQYMDTKDAGIQPESLGFAMPK